MVYDNYERFSEYRYENPTTLSITISCHYTAFERPEKEVDTRKKRLFILF